MSDLLFDRLHTGLGAAIDLRQKQVALTATNLANADTPGFKAKRLDFDAALDQVFEQLDGQVALPDAALPIEELAPEDWVTDGNSVVLEKENAVMAETFTMYSALTTGLSKRLALLRYAASDGR
ncbi:MAG: hypothetical protein GY913_32825 [Proteobacteria bacterium]|nr:hypothetical protein [Pseudomonadota bacterium]MCP4921708.1 hypothetical protein [Pseudomonadota bacterium]